MEYVLDLNALLAYLIATHPKHGAVVGRLSKATRIIVPDLVIVELQWVVLSRRYPEVDEEVLKETVEAIKTDPSMRLEAVTAEIAGEHMKWYKKLSFFDAYYAAFSVVHKRKLLTTDRDFEPYDFAEVV
ncbi:MAG: PIN domain-containing protein [Candidatus Geothermarchaeales archaeon]